MIGCIYKYKWLHYMLRENLTSSKKKSGIVKNVEKQNMHPADVL